MTDRLTNDAERAEVLLALAVADRSAAGRCPDPERILAWHEQSLDAAGAAQVHRHVAHCEHCRTLHRGLLETAAPETSPAAAPDARRWWQRLGIGVRPVPVALGAAMVAGVAALMLVNAVFLQPGAIPDYSLTIQGQSLARGADDAPGDPLSIELRDGNQFSLLLRPATALDEEVAAAFFVIVNGVARQLDAPPARRLDKGVVLVEGRVGADVLLPAGATPLLIVVGRDGELPGAEVLQRRLDAANPARSRHWAAWRVLVQHPE